MYVQPWNAIPGLVLDLGDGFFWVVVEGGNLDDPLLSGPLNAHAPPWVPKSVWAEHFACNSTPVTSPEEWL